MDVSTREDQLGYVYNSASTVQGDFEINMQVKTVPPASSGKAGIMVRTAIDERAPMAGIIVEEGGKISFIARDITGAEEIEIASINGYVPPQCYLKLVRTGNILSAYISADGYNTVKIGQTNWVTDQVYSGAAVIPKNSSLSLTARFSQVTFGSPRSSFLFPLRVEMKDNGYQENNITKPQLRITNLSPDLPLTNFRVRLWFSREEVPAQTILTDKYYTEPSGVQVQVSPCTEDPNLIKVDLVFPANYSLLPGATTAEQGLQIGVHFNAYYPGQWVKSNDWSYLGITSAWNTTQRITVYDKDGNFIYGCEPERPWQATSSTPVILGCENTGEWTLSRGLIVSTTNKTEGAYALQITGGGYQELASKMVATGHFSNVTSKIGLDVLVGIVQPNASWIGEVQIYATCSSAGIYNTLIGRKDLKELTRGSFSTILFELPEVIKNALEQVHSDFKFTVILNTNTNSGPYTIDNLRFR